LARGTGSVLDSEDAQPGLACKCHRGAFVVGFFLVWLIAVRTLRIKALWPVGTGESWTWLAASLLWAPLVFVPLHYFTQGYLTASAMSWRWRSNQLPVNALALAAGRLVWKSLAPGANQPRQ
jgi:hypothetical protein